MTRHRAPRWASLLLLLSVGGCGAILGLDDYDDAQPGAPSGTGAAGASGSTGASGGTGGTGGGAASGGGGDGGTGPGGHGGGGPTCGDGVAEPGEVCFAPAIQLETTAKQASSLVLMDCDDDGDLDVLVAHEDANLLTAFRNGGDGTFGDPAFSDTFIKSWDMEAVETTADAQVLMLIGFPQRFVRLRRMPGQPCAFTQDSTYNVDVGGLRAIGVLDADGMLSHDVIVSNDDDGTGKPMQYAYDFGGEFPDFNVADSACTQPHAIAIGNVAGAGDDIVVTDLVSRKVEVRQYYTGYGLLFPEVGEVGNNPIGLAVGDINGDFRDDAITANEADGTVSFLMNNGDEGFDKPDADMDITGGDPALGSPRDLVLADFDGDGDRDLAVLSSYDGMGKSFVTLFLNAGGGSFSPAMTATAGVPFPAEVGRQPWAIRAADLNGDEIPDIVTANHFDDGTTSTVSILLSNP